MIDCVLDENLRCVHCGWQSPRPNVRRECRSPDAGSLPSIFARVSKWSQAVAKWLAAGRPTRTDEQVADLLKICRECEKYDHDHQRCNLCGCKASKSSYATTNKLRMATEACPLNPPKWVALGETPPKNRQRVGFVLPHIQWGGVELWLDALAAHLPVAGVDVSGVAVFGRAESVDATLAARIGRSCPVVSVSPHGQAVQSGAEAIWTVAQASDVLVVWSVNGASLNACRATGNPLIGVSHGCGDWWMKDAAPYISSWAAVSEAASAPIPSQDVTVIRNGVDVERARRVTISREEMRREAGIPIGARVVVSIGRIAPEKRLHLLSGALDRLPPDVWLWLVGSGTERERAKIIEAAGCAADRLVITVPRDDIGNVLAAADCFGFASQSEGYGLAPVEALAAGVPLVATPVGVLPDLAGAAEFVPIDPTVGQVADAILEAMANGQRRTEAARQVVEQEHSAEAMARAWTEFLTEVTRARNFAPADR